MMAQGLIPACLATADLCGSYVGADDGGFPRAMNDLFNEWRHGLSAGRGRYFPGPWRRTRHLHTALSIRSPLTVLFSPAARS